MSTFYVDITQEYIVKQIYIQMLARNMSIEDLLKRWREHSRVPSLTDDQWKWSKRIRFLEKYKQ